MKRRQSPGFLSKQSAQAANLDTLVREEESGIVRREQADHLVPQQLLQTPSTDEEVAQRPSAEFHGEFWDTAPPDADDDTDAGPDAASNARPVVLYSRNRRLAATVGFAIAFSVMLILLLGEAVAWLLRHS